MLQRLRNSRENEKGFTLIELLVVILIIAILAAIAIPVFLRQRQKGWVAQNESALANGALAIEDCSVEADGKYDGLNSLGNACGVADGSTLVNDHGWRYAAALTGNVVVVATASTYCIQVSHPDLVAAAHPDAVMVIDNGARSAPVAGTC